MIRKISVAALSAALVLATTPSFACTGISLKAGDGAAIRGRTLEFGFPLQSNVHRRARRARSSAARCPTAARV